jgi:hypothetical protein
MANQKQCKQCGKSKDTTQFSKCSSSKDKLQPKCKTCNKKDNQKFRKEINPEHHAKWQTSNWDKFMAYIRKYRKADKNGIIYSITNPYGEIYIGMSEMYLNVRIIEHKKHYRQYKEGKRTSLPGLHDSFDKYGVDNHRFQTIFESEGIDRKQLEYIERSFINAIEQTGKSLNVRYW